MTRLPTQSLQVVLRRQISFLMFLGMFVLFGVISFSALLIIQSFIGDQEVLVNAFLNETEDYLEETQTLLHVGTSIIGDHSHEHSIDDLDVILRGIKEENPRFDSIYIMDERGHVYYEVPSEFSVLNLDLSTEIYFSSVADQPTDFNVPYVTDPFISIATGNVSVIVAEGIWSSENVFEGVLVGVLNLTELQREVDRLASNDETVFITDHYNKYVAHPNSDWVQEQRYYRMSDPLFRFTNQFELVYEDNLGGWNIRSSQVNTQGWMVVVLVPVGEIIGPLFLLLLVAGTTVGVSLVLSYLNNKRVRRSLFNDLNTVVARLETVSRGDYQRTLPQADAKFHEIQIIYESFARMLDAIIERDTTLEQRVTARTNELEIANQELESFAYSVSHDLRAPLRAINGFAHLLQEDYSDSLDEEAESYLVKISQNSFRMDQLIRDLLQLSRIVQQELARKKVDMGKLAQQVFLALQEGNDSRSVNFEIMEPLEAYGDENLIRMMLTNLLSNAYKFTKYNDLGEIRMGVIRDEQDGPTVYFMEDNGVGFNMEYADQIFSPFHRLHSSSDFEGTGIGLAIVQRVVKRHGGKVWVESRENGGTTFFFTLGI